MNDVIFRINTSNPVRRQGTIVVKTESAGSGIAIYRGLEQTMANEVPNTGLVDRYDDRNYYAA